MRSAAENDTWVSKKSASCFQGWNRTQASCYANTGPFADIWTVGKLTSFSDHGADREIVRSSTRLRTIAVDEEKLIDAIRRRSQEIPMEAKDVPITGIDAGDRAASH